MAIFDFYKEWITPQDLKDEGFVDNENHDLTDLELEKACIYGAEMIDKVSGYRISKQIGENSLFPSNLTNFQQRKIKQGAIRLAKQVLDYGADQYLRGQTSINVGTVSISQTNPQDPFYIPDIIRENLLDIGMYEYVKGSNFKTSGNFPETPFEREGFADTQLSFVNFDYLLRNYISKRDPKNNLRVNDPFELELIVPEGDGFGYLELSLRFDTLINELLNDKDFEKNIIDFVREQLLTNDALTEGIVEKLLSTDDFFKQFSSNAEVIAIINKQVSNEILTNQALQDRLAEAIQILLENDEEFEAKLVKAIGLMLESNSKFLNDLKEILTSDSGFVDTMADILKEKTDFVENISNQVQTLLSSNTEFANNIATSLLDNQDFLNKIIEIISSKMSELLTTTFAELAKTTPIAEFEDETITDKVNSKQDQLLIHHRTNGDNTYEEVNTTLTEACFKNKDKELYVNNVYNEGFKSGSKYLSDEIKGIWSKLEFLEKENNEIPQWLKMEYPVFPPILDSNESLIVPIFEGYDWKISCGIYNGYMSDTNATAAGYAVATTTLFINKDNVLNQKYTATTAGTTTAVGTTANAVTASNWLSFLNQALSWGTIRRKTIDTDNELTNSIYPTYQFFSTRHELKTQANQTQNAWENFYKPQVWVYAPKNKLSEIQAKFSAGLTKEAIEKHNLEFEKREIDNKK